MEGGRISFGEKIVMRKETLKKACELSIKAHNYSTASELYIHGESPASSEALFAFAGSWSENEWYSQTPFGETKIDLALFPSLRSIGNEETALVNEAFLVKFKAILEKSSLANLVANAIKEKKRIIFTGQSSGGPLAMLATLWFLEKYTRKDGNTSPLCITFGSPLIGDRIFPHAIRRENWSHYFINFVMRYDIVPLIMLAPFSSIKQELPRVLHFFNPKSPLYNHDDVSASSEASSFYMNVLIKASSVTSLAACNLMGCTNSLLGNFAGFVEFSPYRPFGTYIFCTDSNKMVVLENPDAVFQMLFHFSRLSFEEEDSQVACHKLKKNLEYKSVLPRCLERQNVVFLVSDSDEAVLDELGLYTRARLCLRAAEELENQKLQNEQSIDKEIIENCLSTMRKYRRECELRMVGYYDAFKIQVSEEDFNANVARLELAGIWDEIADMLKRFELPDGFEGNKKWIDLGTDFRRLSEPLDVANYYRHGRNDEAGSYLTGKGRPRRYKFTQRWHEHSQRMLRFEPISESCFWGEVEELRIIKDKQPYEEIKDRIKTLEGQVLQWHQANVLGKDVFLEKSTLTEWWKSLPSEHRLQSCIRGLFNENSKKAQI